MEAKNNFLKACMALRLEVAGPIVDHIIEAGEDYAVESFASAREMTRPEFTSVSVGVPNDKTLKLVKLDSGAVTVGRMFDLRLRVWSVLTVEGARIKTVVGWMDIPGGQSTDFAH